MRSYWLNVLAWAAVTLVLGASSISVHAQSKEASEPEKTVFFDGTLSEATSIVSEKDLNFLLFLWEDKTDSLTTYYRDSLFTQVDLQQLLKPNFVCISAQKGTDKGNTLIKQFRIEEFPVILFVDRRGNEFYTTEGRLEIDQMLDVCERGIITH